MNCFCIDLHLLDGRHLKSIYFFEKKVWQKEEMHLDVISSGYFQYLLVGLFLAQVGKAITPV